MDFNKDEILVLEENGYLKNEQEYMIKYINNNLLIAVMKANSPSYGYYYTLCGFIDSSTDKFSYSFIRETFLSQDNEYTIREGLEDLIEIARLGFSPNTNYRNTFIRIEKSEVPFPEPGKHMLVSYNFSHDSRIEISNDYKMYYAVTTLKP